MKVRRHIRVIEHEVHLPNGEVKTFASLADWYDMLGAKYPKFYKMDDLCKLTWLAVEELTRGMEIPEETALCFCNSEWSEISDDQHRQSLEGDKPTSPAVFVYTLPSIMMGELAIRHHLYGENHFYGASVFTFEEWKREAERLLMLKDAPLVIGGWVSARFEEFSAELYIVENID